VRQPMSVHAKHRLDGSKIAQTHLFIVKTLLTRQLNLAAFEDGQACERVYLANEFCIKVHF
jgi:hypothetical protein